MRFRGVWERLLSGYWFLPAVIVVAASAAALLLLELDVRLDEHGKHIGFTGSPDSARELLSTIASSMLTLTALVFSVTVIALQLASGQFSPRVLRTFLRDHRNQATLGVFLAAYVYALLVLRAVRSEGGGPGGTFVPGAAVTGSFALVAVAIALFVMYIHNIANSLRVIEIIDRISNETIAAIERVHPADAAESTADRPTGPPVATVRAASRGVLLDIDLERLAAAIEPDDQATVIIRIGDFVATGSRLIHLHRQGGHADVDDHRLRAVFSFGKERDIVNDPAAGFRQLIDIAERALSPGVNDPTTATQVLDYLHDLLRRMLHRPLPRWRYDGDGRVALPQYTWEDYVRLALDEIRHWGADSLQIHRRIEAMLEDLAADATLARAHILQEQRNLVASRLADLPPAERATATTTASIDQGRKTP